MTGGHHIFKVPSTEKLAEEHEEREKEPAVLSTGKDGCMNSGKDKIHNR